MPRVSIIIPTCNRARFLQAAIESVLRQTFQDFEILVIDDASEDSTAKVVGAFKDSRLTYVRHGSTKGQGMTRNDGIVRAMGEYVALLDDDDQWLPHKLELQVAQLDAAPARVGLVYTGFHCVDPTGKRVRDDVVPEKRGYIFTDMCERNWIGTCSTVVLRKACLDSVGLFDETLTSGADYDLWIRVCERYEIEFIVEPLVLYTIHGARITTSREARLRGLEALLEKHAAYFAMDHVNYGGRYGSLGVQYCSSGDMKKGRRALRRAVALSPLAVRHYLNLGLSLFGAAAFKRVKALRDDPLDRLV